MTLTFQYGSREARLSALVVDGGPETYDLCADHADRTRPPHGWTLHDERPVEAPVDLPDPQDLRSSHTVAVLAAALRGEDAPTGDDDPDGAVPDPPALAEDADVPGQLDVDALDAIVDQPFDDQADLFAGPDEADPGRASEDPTVSSDGPTGRDALSEHPDPPPAPPGRTVPGARRPS